MKNISKYIVKISLFLFKSKYQNNVDILPNFKKFYFILITIY